MNRFDENDMSEIDLIPEYTDPYRPLNIGYSRFGVSISRPQEHHVSPLKNEQIHQEHTKTHRFDENEQKNT